MAPPFASPVKSDGPNKPNLLTSELSEDEKHLQDELNSLISQLQQTNQEHYVQSLEEMAKLIRDSTNSMTSVPKPLKFMLPHYETMTNIYKNIKDSSTRELCADILSVLAMTKGRGMECLQYRLLANAKQPIGAWGHEYVRHLSSEIATHYLDSSPIFRKQLVELVKEIVPYNIAHNAEADACDLLMEIDELKFLLDYVDAASCRRVVLYLQSCYPYMPEPENTIILETALQLTRKFKLYAQAMRFALMLNNMDKIREVFNEVKSPALRKQLAFLLGRQQICLELNDEALLDIMSNTALNKHFLNLVRELDIMEPKIPEDVYKTHLESNRMRFVPKQIDSAKQNLAASFVNGFLNAGFGVDKLLSEDGNKWLYKNKDHGMLSATASLGLIMLWDVDGGLTTIDKYLYASDDYIKSGALLACGMINCGIRNEVDPAHALLCDHVSSQNSYTRIGAILGLGIAYAGSNRQIVIDTLKTCLVSGSKNSTQMEIMAITAISLGLICVGSCNVEITELLLETVLALTKSESKNNFTRFLYLALGLIYLGHQKAVDAVLSALEVLSEPHRSFAITLVDCCAYAGTGNVLKVQQMLHICSEHYVKNESAKKDKPKEKETNKNATVDENDANGREKVDEEHKKESKDSKDLSDTQSVAVLGIGLIGMGEDVGSEMINRSMDNLLRYCEPCVRRTVPLALALISVSNPKLNVIDRLSKFSHDADTDVAYSATLAMGIVGAGTNNARLAAILRQLAQFHAKDTNCLFMVRIAQGLTHLGKGTISLSPYHSDRQLMNPMAVAGLMCTLVSMLDVKNLILYRSHYLLYTLVPAMQARMLFTLDEDLNQLSVSVRVGVAIDVVGQAGKPKTITGFQTHTTPVLLGMGERAELGTDEYVAMSPILEGFVILKKNPDLINKNPGEENVDYDMEVDSLFDNKYQ